MFIRNRLTQHVSGIIMPIVRTDCIKPLVVLAWMCWLRLCGIGTRAELFHTDRRRSMVKPFFVIRFPNALKMLFRRY